MSLVGKINYFRLDIQGLRGLAILSVILFHFFPTFFPYGYLGVDIFFVISGFLITSIISTKLEKKNFSFKLFFIKRVYRIILPLLFVIFFFGIISFFILLPKDLNFFWNSTISTLFFVPNIFFWVTGGYFGTANEYKPLLHLWSIGLELQFYFFFPFILVFIFKYFNNKKIFFFILLIFFFIINLFIVNTSFSFFNLPGRIWEFLIGSFAFILPKTKKKIFFYYIFFFFIFFFLFFFNNLSFLSLFVLVVSTGIVIYYNSKSILNHKIFQFFGKISYSLYLIHWPLLVFVKYYLIRDLFYYETFFLLFLSIIISYYFWLYVENVFRKKLLLQSSIRLIVTSFVLLFIIYFLNFFNNSFENRLATNNLLIANSVDSHFRCNIKNINFTKDQKSCNFFNSENKDVLVLLGNSHAQMYGYAFENIVNKFSLNGKIIALDGCLPTVSHNISKGCMDKAAKNLSRIIEDKNISIVIIGIDWNNTFLFDKFNNKIENNIDFILAQSLNELSLELNKYNKKTFIIGPISIPGYHFAFNLSRKIFFNNDQIILNTFNYKSNFDKRYKNIFNYLNNIKSITLIKPHEVQCGNLKCNFLINGKSIFSDNNHLSKDGSLLMESILFETISKEILKK